MNDTQGVTPQTLATPTYFWPVVGLVVASLVIIGMWYRAGSPIISEQGQVLETAR